MSLQKLDVYRVRNILQASILPSPAINLIYGNNGSGKSSLLEAIFILGRARSFRTNSIKTVINQDANDLIVSGQILQKNGFFAHLGIQLTGKEGEIHINQQSKCKRAELAYALPIQLIHPKSYQLLDSNSGVRREFIDWGVFNQNDTFLTVWRKFKKSLLQRNVLLKSKSFRQIRVWDNELVQYANQIAQFRLEYVHQLEPIFNNICRFFLSFENVKFKFLAGWDESKDLQHILTENLEKDSRLGFTQYGPHRSDFQLLINHRFAKDFVSRGQLKLLILSLKIAQVQLMYQKSSKIGCILIDDLTAELDSLNRTKFLQYLSNTNFQVFISATELIEFGNLNRLDDFKLFHMEHGKIQQI